MPPATRLIRTGDPAPCAGAERFTLSPHAWRDLPAALRADPTLDLVALWADASHVHALFGATSPLIASVPVEAGLYGALSPARPGAALFERAIADLWGHQAADALDARPWLDHGAWTTLRPMADRPAPNTPTPEIPEFHAGPPNTTTQTIGPLGTGITDAPAQWHIATANGRVVQVEVRAGYAHRGALSLIRGRSPAAAARVAARISGAATVAHATAFARACESAANILVPPRAQALRTALLAIERIAIALHDTASPAPNLHDPALMHARERLLQACAPLGHRLMMDVVVPGGLTVDLSPEATRHLDATLDTIPLLPTPTSTHGQLPIAEALALALPGPAGRASGRLDPATPGAPLDPAGDTAARLRLRAAACAADIALARETLAILPEGPVLTALPPTSGEGLGHAKGPQGRVWHWTRLQGGIVTATFAIDPAWLLLPALERAAQGTPPAQLPTLAASFGLHLPGMDL